MSQNLLSAPVVIGALRVKYQTLICFIICMQKKNALFQVPTAVSCLVYLSRLRETESLEFITRLDMISLLRHIDCLEFSKFECSIYSYYTL